MVVFYNLDAILFGGRNHSSSSDKEIQENGGHLLPHETEQESTEASGAEYSLLYCSLCLNHKKNRYILQMPGLFIPTRILGGGNHERIEGKEGKNN
jgi:hypothetical protein